MEIECNMIVMNEGRRMEKVLYNGGDLERGGGCK